MWGGVESASKFALQGGSVINGSLVHLHVGLVVPGIETVLARHRPRALIEDHARQFGVELGGMDTPISMDPDSGRAWRPRFDSRSVRHEQRVLQAACYVLCAYLTGMRDSEVQAMRVGCLRTAKSQDGLVQRFYLQSRVYKEREEAGEAETWVTIEEVASAVAVLEELSRPIREKRGGETLWRVFDHPNRKKEHIGTEISKALRVFCEHINLLAGDELIPRGPDGRVLAPHPMQFRRTIAWYIGNRPFGVVAGKIQLKQVRAATFEGYAGTSASGLPQEVETEHYLGRLDDMFEYFEAFQGGRSLSGGAKKRVEAILSDALAALSPLPGQVVDPTRVRAMLANLARTLYVGPLADCFFEPEHAVCLKNASSKSKPQISVCAPTKCANACITDRHAPAWKQAQARAETFLKNPRLPPLQRQVLQDDVRRYRRIVEELES